MQKGHSNTILVTVVVIILLIGAVVLVSKRNPTVAPEKAAPTSTPSGKTSGIVEGDQNGAVMTSIDVSIKDFAYTPATLTIKKGAKVTWKNEDSAAHTVTADDKSFDSGSMAQGKTFSHVFSTAGTFSYVCTFHPNMKAKVIVK